MKKCLICFILLMPILICNCGPRKSNAQDNAILAQVLEHERKDSVFGAGFTAVNPMTATSIMDYIPEKFSADGYDLARLVKKLIKRNEKPTRLTLKSSLDDGYLIADQREFYENYYKQDSILKRLNIDIPFLGLVWASVSLPVYDNKEGIVLVYFGSSIGGLVGSDYLIAYRLENGKLREIERLLFGIS